MNDYVVDAHWAVLQLIWKDSQYEVDEHDTGSSNVMPMPKTMKTILNDFKGRRLALIKALTIDADKLHRICDPAMENSYLLGRPDMSWEVVSPCDKLPPKAPEPLLGINFARDGMERLEWLALVASSSDSWLLGIAFFYAAKAGFGRNERKQLFDKINEHRTVFEVFKKASEEPLMKMSGGCPNSSKNRAGRSIEKPLMKMSGGCPNRSKNRAGRSIEKPLMKMSGGCPNSSKNRAARSKVPPKYKDYSTEEEDDEDEVVLCGSCNKVDESRDHLWIRCDFCEKWFHIDCVQINEEKAKRVKFYRCPRCCKKRGRV